MPAINTHDEIELAKLPIARIQDVLLSRMIVREEAARLGFGPQALTQIATAVSEIARNVVQHAGACGQVRVLKTTESGRLGLKIAVEDGGTGITDIERVLAGASPGAGIPGSRKLMDEFGIRSGAGAGTAITMVKWLPSS
ncbi:MAG TPA: ATP-binding protein [Bryobacteraceae bacterium]|nr:ATP-binding protein [Bryobacteraceae bacterium]